MYILKNNKNMRLFSLPALWKVTTWPARYTTRAFKGTNASSSDAAVTFAFASS